MELRNALGARFGLELPATLIFDYPSAAALTGYLASAISASRTAQLPGGVDPADLTASEDDERPAMSARRQHARRGPRQLGASAGASADPTAAAARAEPAPVLFGAGGAGTALARALGPRGLLARPPATPEAGLDSLGE